MDSTKQRFDLLKLSNPLQTVTPEAEHALLGSSIRELGLSPEDVDIDNFNSQLITHMFNVAEQRIGEGLAKKNAVLIRFLSEGFGVQLMGVLHQVLQVAERDVSAEEKNRFFFMMTAKERELRRKKLKIEETIEFFKKRVDHLREALMDDLFMVEEEDPDFQFAKEMLPIIEGVLEDCSEVDLEEKSSCKQFELGYKQKIKMVFDLYELRAKQDKHLIELRSLSWETMVTATSDIGFKEHIEKIKIVAARLQASYSAKIKRTTQARLQEFWGQSAD